MFKIAPSSILNPGSSITGAGVPKKRGSHVGSRSNKTDCEFEHAPEIADATETKNKVSYGLEGPAINPQ